MFLKKFAADEVLEKTITRNQISYVSHPKQVKNDALKKLSDEAFYMVVFR